MQFRTTDCLVAHWYTVGSTFPVSRYLYLHGDRDGRQRRKPFVRMANNKMVTVNIFRTKGGGIERALAERQWVVGPCDVPPV